MYENMNIGKTKIKILHIINKEVEEKECWKMKRRLVIDGNAIYEIDEECRLCKRLDKERESEKFLLEKNKDITRKESSP